MRAISSAELKKVYSLSGGLCAFPDCKAPRSLDDGTPLVEVAYISSPIPGGLRYDSNKPMVELRSYDNLILLCPSHHVLVDRDAERYTAERLASMRDDHVARIQEEISSRLNRAPGIPRVETPPLPPTSRGADRLRGALEIWEKEHGNGDEEFWQQLFCNYPEVLAVPLEGRAYSLKSKCYVGGKSIANTGGNIADFIAQYRDNVAVLEIKTPATRLMGTQYRDNAFSPSRDLVGSCVQLLEYKSSLMVNLPTLTLAASDLRAPAPRAVLIIGNTEKERLSGAQLRSFELFRSGFPDVKIITYDELFENVRMLVNVLA
ncbi:Shedu immune nuclease family protein [Microbispora sp. NPDC088329]|uniref:Shedu immune nuclease family protein n=1 Tax=Microbispora sp. NPDC088329 TaxID=3154869 RepID=UPI00342BF0FD